MEAAQEGHIEIVKFLISKNANIHAVTNTMDTCLTYACANGHTDIAQLLIRCGANVVSTCIFTYMYSTVVHCTCTCTCNHAILCTVNTYMYSIGNTYVL